MERRAETLSTLLERQFPERPCWIEPAVLPKGSKLLFGGEAKVGKSLLLLELCRALVGARNPFDFEGFVVPEAARVLLVEQELGERTLQDRGRLIFAGLGSALDNLFYVSKEPKLLLNTPEGRTLLHDLIDQTQPNVVILDPISKFHTNEENAVEMTRLWNHIDSLIAEFSGLGLSFICSHHFRKPPTGRDAQGYDPLSPYNFRGTSRFYDEVDTLATVQWVEFLNNPWKSWRLRTRWEGRHGELPEELMLNVNAGQQLEVRVTDSSTGRSFLTGS